MHLPMIGHDGCDQSSPVLESARWLQNVWKFISYSLRSRSETVVLQQQNAYVSIDTDAVKRSAVEVSASFTPRTMVR